MFVRTKKHPYSDKYTILICHSHRYGKYVYQHIIYKIGTSNDPKEIADMQEIANEELLKLKQANYKPPKDFNMKMPTLDTVRELSRANSGVKDILGTLYDNLGFNNILQGKYKEILKSIVLARFLEPSSKSKSCSILEKKFNLDISVDSIYRMMDKLEKHEELVKKAVFDSTISVSNDINLMFFDVTTLHMESIAEDELRRFGFSKNFRFNTTQVVLALATTSEGLPIGYKLFPGNTAESKTLIECIQEWRRFINIKNAIVVGDRAIMSSANLEELEKAGMQYIVAFPIKKASKTLKEQILSEKSYNIDVMSNEVVWKKQIPFNEQQRLIITYSSKRHKHDQKEREKLIKRIQAKLGKNNLAKKLISNQGYIKYTKVDGEMHASLDEAKIKRDSEFDGLHAVLTNSNLSIEEVLSRYKNLWKIEESFRINKHSLKMRPIYHFAPRRILSHILICFLTFALARQAQYKLKENSCTISIESLKEELQEVQHSILKDHASGRLYKMPSYMTEDMKKVYRIFGKEKELSIQVYNSK